MTTVFIAGSMNIRKLDRMVKERIDNIVDSGLDIVIGDADGADASIQEYLFSKGASKTTVFCSGDKPRNNIGAWPVHTVVTSHAPGSRAFFTAKDLKMAQMADFGLMVWDTKSTGTLSNIIELLQRKKKCVVFINKEKSFKNIGDIEQLEHLLENMSETARQKAEDKIHLLSRLDALKHEQSRMFA
jgi:hypothetical protein